MVSETFNLYYNVRQLNRVQNMDHVNLYSDRDRKNKVGKAFYIVNSFSQDSITAWAFEYATFFLNDNKDTLIFQNSLFERTTILKEGTYVFQVLGGSNKYLGATGTITFVVNKAGLRSITVSITY